MSDTQPLNVLLLEDNPVDFRLLQDGLREAGANALRLTRAADLAEAMAKLGTESFDVVLSDLSVPDSFGLATVEALLGRAGRTPVVVLTGSEDDKTGRAAVHLGAQDYLVKGETGGELLVRSLHYAIERKHAELALKARSDEVAERAKKQIGRFNDALQLETVERYRIEAALRESERRFRACFEQDAVAMAQIAGDGRLLRVNRRFCALLGYAEDELLAMQLQQLVFPDDVDADQGQHKRLINGAIRHYAVERRFRARDGNERLCRQSVSLVRGDQGEVRYFFSVFEPVERGNGAEGADCGRRLEEAREQQAAVTAELDALSYAISHDLRAPLRAVTGFARILAREHADDLPPESRQYLDMIADGANRLDQLIRDLLAYSRLGRQAMVSQPVALGLLLVECLAMLKPAYEGRDIDIAIAKELPLVKGDPALLKELLMALLGNAVKFTVRQAAARIGVSAEVQEGQAVICVRDNGIGFDMRYAGKLFGVFQRLHRPDEFPGTGIGLAMARRIVQRHHGRIWADAAPNEGASFCFSLPAVEPADIEAQA